MKTYAKIELEVLIDLLNSNEKLGALEGAGVDNWGGYEYAMQDIGELWDERRTLAIFPKID